MVTSRAQTGPAERARRFAAGLRALPLADKVAVAVTVAACLWFTFAAFYGIFQIPGGGHIGAGHAGTALLAEQIVRWHTVYPLWGWFEPQKPALTSAYCHHPFGMYWVEAPFLAVFGPKGFVCSLPASIMSSLTPVLLYFGGKCAWNRRVGAAMALGFVVVPIDVGFASFHNLEVMAIFGGALFFWGTVRYEATRKKRHLLAALAGVFVCTAADWIGWVTVGVPLAVGLLLFFVLPVLSPRIVRAKKWEMGRWWALSATVAVLSLVLWVGLFQHAQLLNDWLASGTMRSSGSQVPLDVVLRHRAHWIDFSFTPFLVTFGKILAPLCALRIVVHRRIGESFAAATLATAVGQYVGFKQGADVHIYWPHYFGAYVAFACGAAVATAEELPRWIAKKLRRDETRIGRAVPVVLGLVVLFVPALAFPDAARSLRIWRETGGRYNDNGSHIRNNAESVFVLEKIVRPMVRGAPVDTHGSAAWGWEHAWALHRRVDNGAAGWPSPGRIWIGRGTGMLGDDQRKLAAEGALRVYGEMFIVDGREPRQPVRAYAMGEREAGLLESIAFGAYYPMRSVPTEPDPFLTWEWRHHLGQQPAVPPTAEPRSLDEIRIAHNAAVAAGDQGKVQALRAKIDAALDTRGAADFEHGLRLIGVRVGVGAERRLEVWLAAVKDGDIETELDVTSHVVRQAPFSFFPPDPTARRMMEPPVMPTKLWRAGMIYVMSCPMLHRVGEEEYRGVFRGRGGPGVRRVDGAPFTLLAIAP
ncbi:MAG: hypothetical protein JNL38_40040 [Myxococcales bacterium]|nr:hypothetical protein [Myxococcales bacterium]